MANLPKFKLIYFKHLLDIAFLTFFNENNNCFVKEDDKYVLASNMSKTKIRRLFKSIISLNIQDLVGKFDRLDPLYLFVIGACMPNDNLLLKHKDGCYLPLKLEKILLSKYQLKYILCEDDIHIDIVMFNLICIDIFNDFFKLSTRLNQNIFFMTHSRLDCYMMFKCLKKILGKSNCINLFLTQDIAKRKAPIVAVNDMLARYIHNKSLLSSDAEFLQAFQEVKLHVLQLLTNF